MAAVVRDGFNTLWEDRKAAEPTSVKDLVTVGESKTVEFKSTGRWNLHVCRTDKKIEHVISKTVCGFLNAEGGELLIGVDDNGRPVGLANGMQTLGSKADRDGYELFLRQHLDNSLSVRTAGIVRTHF